MNKIKFFLSAGALIWAIFSMPFGNSCLYGSDNSASEDEREDVLLFKGRKGFTIPRTKLQAFLAPEFTVSLKCNVALTSPDDIDPALKKLQSLAVQFVREVSMRESDVPKRINLFMATFERVNEMTVNATSCLMPLYTIGSYRLIGTVINGINNALYKKVLGGQLESGTTSKGEPVYSTANNQRAFQAVKQAFGLSLLTVLHEDGEEVDEQLAVYKKMSQGLFEDDEEEGSDSCSESSDGSEDEEKSLRSMIASEKETIVEQNKTYQASKKRYQEYLETLTGMEKIRAELPMKNHVIGLIFLSLGFEEADVKKTMHYLLDQGEFANKAWPLILEANSAVKSTKTKLTFKSSKEFLEKLLQIINENPMVETPPETPYFVEEETLLEDLLCHEPESSDLSEWLDLLSSQSGKNSRILSELNWTNDDLKVIEQKAVAEIIGVNEPLVRFFKGFYGYLGGTDVGEFMDVFVKKTKKRLVKEVRFEGAKFPKTRDKFVDGLWRFLHKDKI